MNSVKKYEFNKEKHLHLLDGKPLTGCTTILSVLAKPALIQWAADMVVYQMGWRSPKKPLLIGEKNQLDASTEFLQWLNGKTVEEWVDFMEEARKAHVKRKEKAGEWGTETHETISNLIRTAIDYNEGKIQDIETTSQAIRNFIDWSIKNKVKFLETEKNIYSESLWIGGIVDFICEIERKVWIGDIKTSKSGIYSENFWQCAGYDLMVKEMKLPFAQDIKGYLILNLKESGEFIEKRSISNGDNTKAFLACLEIYRVKEKIKNQIIN